MRPILASFLLAISLVASGNAQSDERGIGVLIAHVPEGLVVTLLAPGSPADRAGVKMGDVIVAIDNRPVSRDTLVTALRGPPGTKVHLTLKSATPPGHRTVEVMREDLVPAPDRAQAKAPEATTRPAQAPSAERPAQAPAAPAAVTFINWVDPIERGFRIDVPQGWQVSGGTHRANDANVRQFARAQSPDGKVLVFFNDPDILPRTVPHPVYDNGREGGVVNLRVGPTRLQRFLTGSQYAQEHIRTHLCKTPQLVDVRDDAALSSRMTREAQPYAQQMGGSATISAGQAGFLCGSSVGLVFATTELGTSHDKRSPIQPWGVTNVSGFITADPLRSMQARYIMDRMMQSVQVDPVWLKESYRRLGAVTDATIARQNALSAHVQRSAAANASTSLARLNNPNPGVPRREGRAPSSVNPTLGTKDVCDAIGRCGKVSTDHDNYYFNHSGKAVAGRPGGGPPDNSGVWTPAYTR